MKQLLLIAVLSFCPLICYSQEQELDKLGKLIIELQAGARDSDTTGIYYEKIEGLGTETDNDKGDE